MAEWSFVLTDRYGRNRAFVEPQGVSLTRRWNGGNEATFSLPLEDEKAAECLTGSRLLKVYQDRTVRLNAPVCYVKRSAAAGFLEATAGDWKRLETGVLWTATGTFTDSDSAIIALTLIDYLTDEDFPETYTHVRSGLAVEYTEGTPLRDRSYDAGQNATEAVLDLCQVDDPIGFYLEPLDEISDWYVVDGAGLVDGAEMRIVYPATRAVRPVSFEFGDGTLDNLADFEEEEEPPRNFAVALSDGLAPSVEYDAESFREYGSWFASESFSDIKKRATLRQHALGLLEPAPRKTYALSPRPGGPRPWEDFDVGDVVSFKCQRGVLEASGQGRVTEFTVDLPDHQADAVLKSLVLEEV